MVNASDELTTLIGRFVGGANRSLQVANRLEVILDERYPEDKVVQACVGDLARYQPGGGDFLFDAGEMVDRLRRLDDYLRLSASERR